MLKTILVVDLHEAHRLALRETLEKEGYRVHEASSCAEAREYVKRGVGLVILHVELADGDGFAFAAELKANPRTAHVPVLMTAASFMDRLADSADGYLTMPINPLEMIANVRALLRVRSMEQQLRNNESQLRLMFESIRDHAIFTMDVEGRINSWNAGAEHIFGYAEEDVMGCSVSMLFTSEERASGVPQREMAQAQATGRAEDDRWLVRRDGTRFFASGIMNALRDDAGQHKGFIKVARDVTENIKIQELLRASEERFDLAMKGMTDGLWDYDPVQGTVYFSPRFKAMLGYDNHEYPDSTERWSQDLHPEDHDKAWQVVREFMDDPTRREYRNIFRVRHKDGCYRWILSRGAAVRDASGKAVRMVGAHTDITEQKEMEQALREAYSRAESANNAKSEFLANMSHEIRTPMNAIIGLANILSDNANFTQKQKQYLTTLQLSAESLMELINDMLDFARIEGNMIELEETPFSLRELMERVIGMMSVKAQEKQLQLRLDWQMGQTHFIGDSLRLQQVIVNLVNNAIKFTDQGSVAIEVSGMAVERGMYKITVCVSDTGIGIPQNKLYAIFDKFTQADASITRKYGGSGLGLTISKALIERMGGNIHVASREGKGSVFTINVRLPVAQAHAEHAQQEEAAEEDVAAPSAGRVLLVEDYAPNVLVATTLLEEFGYAYDTASNGRQALDMLAQGQFDVVLMDVQMQDMDGLETTRRMRALERAQGREPLPVIAMTAHALVGDKEKCLEAGMNDYISKPFNPAELKLKLAYWLEREQEAA